MSLTDKHPRIDRRNIKEGDYPVGHIFKDHMHAHWNGEKQTWDDMIVTSNGIMPVSCLFVHRYPHLYLVPRENGTLWCWKRRVHGWGRGYTWDGLARDGEPLMHLGGIMLDDPNLHLKLEALELLCAPASRPGHFLCGECHRDRTDLAGTNFNAYYCKECYDKGGSAYMAVEEAKRPNYYE